MTDAKLPAWQVVDFLSSAGHHSVTSNAVGGRRSYRRGDGTIEYRPSLKGRWGGFRAVQDGAAVLVRFEGAAFREADRLAAYRQILENCLLAVTEEDDPVTGRRRLRVTREEGKR